MNGTEVPCPAEVSETRVVFDTNVVIKYINKLPGFIDLDTRFAGRRWLISFITRMEILAFPGISAAEKERALAFLQSVSVISITKAIEAEAGDILLLIHIVNLLEVYYGVRRDDGPEAAQKILRDHQ
ncbi:hypothetical protein AGMMS49944_31590 [Spirochaetia bacterium]|nr:hypothetical protein AGMMS49944_31590 [Spirochaetia bacterium]